ncbi:MAG: hypothetical protein LBU28_04705 [Spirochaetaceae bacterium]|jgi:hypothetical protein|nr:hypothetical protein [Spirochaetaceae bacterium]
MDDRKYYQDYEDFQKEHPEIDPSWREFVEPVVIGADDGVFNFICGYILI